MTTSAIAILWTLAQEGGDSPNRWWVYLVCGILLLAVLVLPRRLARKSRMLDEPRSAGARQQHELRRSMDRLLVELQETAREINATIDTKMLALKRLIDEADAQIRTLKELQSRREEPKPEPRPRSEPVAPPPPEPPLTEEARRRRALEERIFQLSDEGKSILEIARITDVPRGEVELVLSLRERGDG